jgi:peptidoglycan-N-acetylglucosamine deacetylase
MSHTPTQQARQRRRAAISGGVWSAALAAGAAVAVVASTAVPEPKSTGDQGNTAYAAAEDAPVATPDPTGASNSATSTTQQAPPTPTVNTPVAVAPQVLTHGPRSGNGVAITLDADLSYWSLQRVQRGEFPAQYNSAVLDYLEASGTPSTVFVTGLWAEQYPTVMQRIAGSTLYELANHTWSHEAWTPNCYRLPFIDDPARQTSQLRDTSEIIASYTESLPRFFRFPGLCHDPADVALVAEHGMVTVDTDVAAGDAFITDPGRAARDIAIRTQPGSIIVLHLNGAPNASFTAEILSQLVPMLRGAGLEPMTLSQLLDS